MNILKEINGVKQIKENLSPETIYANGNFIKYTKPKNDPVPHGRKPALPPKPPNCAALISKPKGFVQSARAALFEKKSPQGKIDPAELTLKERLALFEKNDGAALIAKAPLAMSITNNQNSCDIQKMPLLPSISTETQIVACQISEGNQ